MAEEGKFKGILFAMALISLFSFLMIFSAIQQGNEYGMDVSELEGEKLNLTGLNETIQNINATAEEWKETFTDFNILDIDNISKMWNLLTTMWGVIVSPLTLILQIFTDVFMLPALVTGVVLFMVIVTVIFAIWRLMKIGD